MSDYDLPDLPSDEELGISEEDLEGVDLPDDRPEMSAEEMAALLGAVPVKKTREEKSKAKKSKAKKAKGKKAEGKRPPGAKRRFWSRSSGGGSEPPGAESSGAPEGGEPGDGGSAPREAGSDTSSGTAGDGPTTTVKDAVGAPAPESRSRWRGPVTLLALIAAAWIASPSNNLPTPVPASAPDTAFSSARAMSTLIEIARRPHPVGSAEHTRVREFLVERLTGLGLTAEIQTTTAFTPTPRGSVPGGGVAVAATVRNVVARLPGTDPSGAVLVTAHYDSRDLAPGAADAGSGVVSILESLRAVQAGRPLRNDLIVLFTDAEERGMIGATAFVSEHPWMDDVSLVISLEMRGAGGPSIMFETNDDNGWVLRALRDGSPGAVANSMSGEVYRRLPNATDFTLFRAAGKQGLNFGTIGRGNVYHQGTDTPESLSEATLQHHGTNALGVIRQLGNADLTEELNAPDLVAFRVPVLGLVLYQGGWVLPFAGGLLVMAALALVLARRAGMRWGGFAGGVSIAAVLLVAGYGFGATLLARTLPLHAEAGRLELSAALYHEEQWYAVGLAFGVTAIAVLLVTLVRRWLSPVEMAMGGLVLPLAIATALAASAPMAAMNLQWPVLAATLAAVVVALRGRTALGVGAWMVTLLLALSVMFMMEPLIEFLWLAMAMELAAAYAAFMVVGLLMLLPALEALRHPNSWWAPTTLVALSAIAIGIGVLRSGPSADRPAPSTLVYAYEWGAGGGLWATDEPTAVTETSKVWAEQVASVEFASRLSLSDFGYLDRQVPVASAPPLTEPRPLSLSIGTDTLASGAVRAALVFRSNVGAEMIRLSPVEAATIRWVSVNGRAVPAGARVIEHWGVPDGDRIIVDLELPAGVPFDVDLVEHVLAPTELLGVSFERPPGLAPDYSRLSDRAMLKTSIRGGTVGGGLPVPDSVPQESTVPDTVVPDPVISGMAAPDSTISDSISFDSIAPTRSAPDTLSTDGPTGDELG